jgi:lysophospholipid acyltransferase (LPLAT)-like uncharacterized protein
LSSKQFCASIFLTIVYCTTDRKIFGAKRYSGKIHEFWHGWWFKSVINKKEKEIMDVLISNKIVFYHSVKNIKE